MENISAICKRWGISRTFFYKLVSSGRIKTQGRHPLTGRIFFDEKTLAQFDSEISRLLDAKKMCSPKNKRLPGD